MVIVFVVSSILGGALTLALLWPYGLLVAVLGAPFGASLTAILVAGLIILRGRGHDKELDRAVDHSTDEMVAVLRQAVEQGRAERASRLHPTGGNRRAS